MNFTHHCTSCDKTQLIFPSMFTGVSDIDGQSSVDFTCWCGAAQSVSLSQGSGVCV